MCEITLQNSMTIRFTRNIILGLLSPPDIVNLRRVSSLWAKELDKKDNQDTNKSIKLEILRKLDFADSDMTKYFDIKKICKANSISDIAYKCTKPKLLVHLLKNKYKNNLKDFMFEFYTQTNKMPSTDFLEGILDSLKIDNGSTDMGYDLLVPQLVVSLYCNRSNMELLCNKVKTNEILNLIANISVTNPDQFISTLAYILNDMPLPKINFFLKEFLCQNTIGISVMELNRNQLNTFTFSLIACERTQYNHYGLKNILYDNIKEESNTFLNLNEIKDYIKNITNVLHLASTNYGEIIKYWKDSIISVINLFIMLNNVVKGTILHDDCQGLIKFTKTL